MSRGNKSQQCWAWGAAAALFAVFVAATFSKSQQNANNVAGGGVTCLPSQFLGRQNPRKQAFCACHDFWDVNNWLPYTPVGAEWDAIAIPMGTLSPDGC